MIDGPTELGAEIPDRGVSSRITILDAMIAIAATAVAIAWTRSYVIDYLLPMLGTRGALPQRYGFARALSIVPTLSSASLGLLAIGAFRGDLRARRSVPGPGLLASSIAAAYLLLQFFFALVARAIAASVPGWRLTYGIARPTPISYIVAYRGADVGVAIAGLWLIQAAVRAWHPSTSPIESAGRWLGAAWIVVGLGTSIGFDTMML